MSQCWISADYHFGEDRMELMQRPFSSTQEHDDTIIRNHNKVVGPKDVVYVNGDAIYQKSNFEQGLEKIASMNGQKILIRGNHDRPFSDEQFLKVFVAVIAEGDGSIFSKSGITGPVWMTHYPTQGKADHFNLVGHIHAAWKFQLNMLNVGVDVHHFYPVNLEQIPFFFTAISQFYDEDVWVGYNPINSNFQSSRGKKSRYFTEV